MINYGYFRHRFDASSDPKLQALVDEMGIAALGYYFSLLEIYGHYFSKKDSENGVVIHRRVLSNTWRKRVDSCDKVLTKLQLSDLLVYTKCKNTYIIDIPNFLKYYGSYKKTHCEKTPNKRKEKKNKIKVKQRDAFSHSLGFCADLSEPEVGILTDKYGHKMVQSNIEKDFIFYKKNPMRKSFFDFFSDSLQRKSDWEKSDVDNIEEMDSVVSSLMERVKKEGGRS